MSDPSDADGSVGVLSAFVARHFDDVTGIQLGALAVVLLALLTAPAWGGPYLYVLSLASIWAIFAMGWDIISGHTGYMSFGHSALSGTAAYTTAILVTQVDPGLSVFVTMPASILAALAVGILFALPSLRLEGPYFSLMTLLAVLLLSRLVYPFGQYTGGELGLRVPRIASDVVLRYYVSLVPMLLIALALLYVSRSHVGMVLHAIRENELAVEDAGLDTTKFKLWAFVLSSIPMGIGGALLAHFYGNVDPASVLVIDRSIEMILMAAIGGMGTVLGPMFGAFLLVFLREEYLPYMVGLGSTERWIALWLIAAALLLYARGGIFPKLWAWLGQFRTLRGLGRGTVSWLADLPARVRTQASVGALRRRVDEATAAVREAFGRGDRR